MEGQFGRTELLLGKEPLRVLASKRVAVFGIGGVGGFALEELARAGVGELDLIDNDEVDLTNLNRQILATADVLGHKKTEVGAKRVHAINPACTVHEHPLFYLPDQRGDVDFGKFDYVVDSLDTVAAKLDIILESTRRGVPVVSALGCGNRVDPTKLVITDIYKTSGDPLAKALRQKLRKLGIKKLPVVCSTEPPIPPRNEAGGAPVSEKGRHYPGSTPFVPAAAGILLAYRVVMDLTGFDSEERRKQIEEKEREDAAN